MDSSGTSAQKEAEGLAYFFSVKNDILVVTLTGPVDKNAVQALQRCAAEIPGDDIGYVILNLAGVGEIDRQGASELIRLQKTFRSRPSKLKVCAMSTRAKEALENFGAIRPSEVARDLVEAIQGRQG